MNFLNNLIEEVNTQHFLSVKCSVFIAYSSTEKYLVLIDRLTRLNKLAREKIDLSVKNRKKSNDFWSALIYMYVLRNSNESLKWVKDIGVFLLLIFKTYM